MKIVQVDEDDGFAFKREDGTFLVSEGASISDSDCKEYFIPCVNASENVSELGNLMCERYPDAPFSMSYCDRGDGMRSYSLRSIGDFDVSVVAKAFGGGGHKNAAGFALPKPQVI